MSLRAFHVFFMAVAIVGAEFFGGWALQYFSSTGDWLMLSLGVVSMLGGLGLAAYALWFIRKMNRANIH